MINYKCGNIIAKLNKKEKILVKDVSFSIDKKQIVSLIGETGSGKSIIAYSIMKLLPDNVYSRDLHFTFDGIDLSGKKNINNLLGNKIVYIPQSGLESLNQSLTISSQIDDTLKKNKIDKKMWNSIKNNLLKKVGFDNPELILNKYPFELSGGMGQKIVIALASISEPKLIIADEPTNGLDNKSKYEIINLLKIMFPTASMLLITHDISIAKLSSKCLILNNGIVLEKGDTIQILNHPNHPYTKSLINAQVENEMKENINIREISSNCPFANRCDKYRINCNNDIPIKENEYAKWRCAND